MVARYKTILMDDLDNTIEAVETVRITRNGETREIDLGKRNLSRYVTKVWEQGRRASSNARPKPPTSSTATAAAADSTPMPPTPKANTVPVSNSNKVDNAKIRAWARAKGIEVTQRGRLPKSIVDQYEEYENNRTVVG